MRCFVVSLGTTALSSAILVTLVVAVAVPAAPANFAAFCCGIPVSYVANRRWVWARRGRSDLVREVGPFWAMNIAGLIVSTLAVGAAGSVISSWSTPLQAVFLPLTSVGSLAALWVVQFVVLDRFVFRRPQDG